MFAILLGDAIIAFTFFMMGRSIARGRVFRTVTRLAHSYRDAAHRKPLRTLPDAYRLEGKADALHDLLRELE